MTDILAPLNQIDVVRVVTAQVESFEQNVADIDTNFTAVRTAVNALCQRVTALESQAAGSPVILNFMVTAPARVDAGTSLAGTVYDATYELLASSLITNLRLVGVQTVPAGSEVVLVADAVRAEGANTQTWTFPSGVDFGVEGNAYQLRLEAFIAGQTPGTDTPTASASTTILTQAAPRSDLFYWGATNTRDPNLVDIASLESQTVLDGDVTLPTFTENSYIVFASPASAPRITGISFGGFQQLGAFPLIESGGVPVTVDVGGTDYVFNISSNLLLPSFFSGEVATITR